MAQFDDVVFEGRTYRWNGKYFRRARTFLHRDVWAHHKGPIPEGYHVHHVDHDTTNNTIENLQLVWGSTHLHHHLVENPRPKPEWAYPALKVWRESPEGKARLAELGKRNSVYLGQEKEFQCECCNEYFFAPHVGSNRFCSNKCKSKWRRDAGLDDVTRACQECGTEFKANKYDAVKNCSLSCGRKTWLKTPAGKAHLEKLAKASRARAVAAKPI